MSNEVRSLDEHEVNTVPTRLSTHYISIGTAIAEMRYLLYKLDFPIKSSTGLVDSFLLRGVHMRVYGANVTHMMRGKAINLHEF